MKNSYLSGHRALSWIQARYLSWTAWGLLIVLFSLLQMMPHGLAILGARPLFLVPLVICIALFNGPIGGAAAGLAAGLLWDLYATHIYGFNALVMMIIGCVTGLLIWLLLRNTWLTAWMLCAVGALTQALLDWLFCYLIAGRDGPGWVLLHTYLPNALLTALISPLFYFLARGVIRTLRKRI